jgi:hypothetical protein
LPSSEPVVGGVEFTMKRDPEDAIANEPELL